MSECYTGRENFIIQTTMKKITTLVIFTFAINLFFTPSMLAEAEVVSEESVDIDQSELDPELKNGDELDLSEVSEEALARSSADTFTPLLDYAADPMANQKSLGVYETNLATGAATYKYPIDLPAGRNGMQPEIYLFYNNQAASSDSIAGYGWSLFTGGQITRTKEYGFEDIYSTNEFYLNMSGAGGVLLPVSLTDDEHGQYGMQVEEVFYKYEFNSDDSWMITDKNGIQYYFGQSADSRQDDADDSTQIFSWMIDEIRDVNGNYVRYEYYKEDGQIYPKAIYYTGYGTASALNDGPIEVRFQPFYDGVSVADERADWTKWYDKGFEVKTEYLLSGIDIVIDGYLSGSPVREYDLSYTVGDNGTRSMLDSIVESGTSIEGDNVVLPETSFGYSSDSIAYSYSGVYAGFSEDSNLIDINGDGYADQSFFDTTGSYRYVYSKLGSGGASFGGDYFKAYYSLISSSYYFDDGNLVDMNGDGLPELIKFINGYAIQDGCLYINYRDGFIGDYWNFCSPEGSYDRELAGYRLGDFNGDGLSDLFTGDIVDADWTAAGEDIYLNNAEYEFEDSGFDSPVAFSWGDDSYPFYPEGLDTGARLVDMNGDGLVDIVSAYQDLNHDADGVDDDDLVYTLYLNTGDGSFVVDSDYGLDGHGYEMIFVEMEYFTPTFIDGSYSAYSQELCYNDVNSDGIVDLVGSDSGAYIWDGVDTWTYVTPSAGRFSCGGTSYGSGSESTYGNADLNGDGLLDFYESNESSLEGPRGVYTSIGTKPDLLTSVSTSGGAEFSISYKSALEDSLNTDLAIPIYVVSEVVTDDGLGNESSISYQYSGGHYYKYFDGITGEFSGFEEVSVTDGLAETVYYFDLGCNDGIACTIGLSDGMVIAVDGESTSYPDMGYTYVVDGDYLREITVNLIDAGFCSDINCDSAYFVYEDADFSSSFWTGEDWDSVSDTYIYDVDGSDSSRSVEVAYEYDTSYGLLISETQFGEADLDGDEVCTENAYSYSESSWVFKQAYSYVSDCDGVYLSKTENYYDWSTSLGYISSGLLTDQMQWLDSDSSWITVSYEYDSYGNIVLQTDPRGYQVGVAYDSENFYPQTITNPLGQGVSVEVNYINGKPTETIDYNGYASVYLYDGAGRLISVSGPDVDGVGSITYVEYDYDDVSMPRIVHESQNDGTADGFNSYNYADGFGRTVQIRVEGEDYYAVTDTSYDENGNVEMEGLAYFVSGSSYSTPDLSQPANEYDYDAAGRIISVSNSMGDIYSDYSLWTETATDTMGNVKVYYSDAYGNLVQVDELLTDESGSSEIYSTYYEYDLLGRMISITDALGNERNFEWDSLGRKTMQEEGHDSADSDYGIWAYEYDENGNLLVEVVPTGESISYTYDELNRVETEFVSDGGSATYVYDTALNGVGLLASVSDEQGSVSYEYDAFGGVVSEERTIGIETYITEFENDLMGRMESVVYPTGSVADYTFNNAGRVETVLVDGESLVTDMDYSSLGQWQNVYYANGDVVTSTYDPEQMYLLDSRTAVSGTGTVLQDLSYQYDDVGNIEWILDESGIDTAKDIYYEYDDLYRLTTAISGTNLYTSGLFTDVDADGLTIYGGDNCPDEFNPYQADWNGDDVGDACQDYDGDGLYDDEEVEDFGSDPDNWDTDDDGFSDYDEYVYGSDWLDATNSIPIAVQAIGDSGINDITSGDGPYYFDSGGILSSEYYLNSSYVFAINAKALAAFSFDMENYEISNVDYTFDYYHGSWVELDSSYFADSESDLSGDPTWLTGRDFADWVWMTLVTLTGGSTVYLSVTFSHIDTDDDSVEDYHDNCPVDSNIDQSDSDSDGQGDVCDDGSSDAGAGSSASDSGEAVDYQYSYEYDAVSNLIYSSDLGDFLYEETGFANPYAVTSVGGNPYEYDQAGNAVSDVAYDYVYDAKNQLISSYPTAGGTVYEYGYDFGGNRVVKNADDGSALYYPNIFYQENIASDGSGVGTEYVFVDGIRIYSRDVVLEAPFDYLSGSQSMRCTVAGLSACWQPVTFSEVFDASADVVVFAQIQSESGVDDVDVDLKNISTTGFSVKIEEDSGSGRVWLDGRHLYETVAWGAFVMNTLPSGVYGDTETFSQNRSGTISQNVVFDSAFSSGSEPVIFAQKQTENGTATVRANILSSSETGFSMELREDQGNGVVGGWDITHGAEEISWIAFLPEDNPFNGVAGSVDIGSTWEAASFGSSFTTTPLVFASIVSQNEADVAIMDLKTVTTSGFYGRVDELTNAGWNGRHVDEEIMYFTIGE